MKLTPQETNLLSFFEAYRVVYLLWIEQIQPRANKPLQINGEAD